MLTGFVVFILLTVVIVKQYKTNKKKKIQQQGLIYIDQIKQLIGIVQQHRGLTSAWLNGDNKVQTKLVVLKQQISQLMKLLTTDDITKNERWVGFADHWQRLLVLNNKPSVANSFEQHTLMIRNLAYLLEDTAEKSYLTADFITELPNIGFVWRELILAIENIGQSRALGTGVAAQKHCSSVDKIRLNFLTQTMTSITKHTLQNLSYLPEQQQIHNNLVQQASVKMTQLIDTISNDLVNAKKVTVEHTEYFELATNTMKELGDIFDHQLKQLHSTI